MLNTLENIELPSKKQIKKILDLILEEEDYPFFYFIPYLLRHIKRKGISREQVIEGLKENGFKASRTIFDPEGLKTNATFLEIVDVIKKY